MYGDIKIDLYSFTKADGLSLDSCTVTNDITMTHGNFNVKFIGNGNTNTIYEISQDITHLDSNGGAFKELITNIGSRPYHYVRNTLSGTQVSFTLEKLLGNSWGLSDLDFERSNVEIVKYTDNNPETTLSQSTVVSTMSLGNSLTQIGRASCRERASPPV